MSVLATSIASATSAAVNQQAAQPGSRPDGGVAQQVTTADAIVTGTAAAIVNLSGAPAEKRGATHGAGRMVDSSFDSKRGKKKRDREESSTDTAGPKEKKVNVLA